MTNKYQGADKIVVILPAHNEEQTIAATLKAFHTELPQARFIVIDNHSQDKTAIIAEKTMKDLHINGEIIYEQRLGKGNAVRRAFSEISADIYVLTDADMTYPANRVHDLIRPIAENRADMVVGDRLSFGHYQQQNKRKFHGLGNRLVIWLINKLFKAKLADVMSGYRAFNRKFIKNYPILVEGFQIETDLTLHALDKRFRILEIPCEYQDRPVGSFSKLNTFRDGAKVIFTITSILRYYRPFVFFGFLTVVFGILGLITAIPVFKDWVLYHFIYHVPLAVLAVAFELVAVIFLGVGLILDSITHQYKMSYERNLLQTQSIKNDNYPL